jgi:hypothetical protein
VVGVSDPLDAALGRSDDLVEDSSGNGTSGYAAGAPHPGRRREGYHQVGPLTFRPGEQHRDDLGWMLKVRVDDGPCQAAHSLGVRNVIDTP